MSVALPIRSIVKSPRGRHRVGLSMLGTLTLTALVFASACTSSDHKSEGRTEPTQNTRQEDACRLLTAERVSKIFGRKLHVVSAKSTEQQCVFENADGPQGVVLMESRVGTPAEFEALVTADMSPVVPNDGQGVKGFDQILVWTETPNLSAGVARTGGAAVTVRILTELAEDNLPTVVGVLSELAGRLPKASFATTEDTGLGICTLVDPGDVASAVGADEISASAVADGCSFSDKKGMTLIVTRQGGATVEQLDVPPIVTSVDGKERVWTVDKVDGVGDAARWTEDPVSQVAGQLTVLFGDRLVRVQSSANEPGSELKERAVALAQLVGGAEG